MAGNSGWSKNVPSGSSSIAQGDDDIRSFKSFMQAWWEQEHYATDGSAASAGIAKHGAGRAFVGPASQLSNPTADNDGRLFWNTTNESLYIGQASSSSWSAVADAIRLDSNNSWTGTNSFTTNKFTVLGAFSEVVSITSANAVARGVGAGDAITLIFQHGSSLTLTDIVMSSFTYDNAGGTQRLTWSSSIQQSDGSIILTIQAEDSASVASIHAGNTFRFLGFRAN